VKSLMVAVAFGIAVGLSLLFAHRAAACAMTEREWYNPTGWEGCTIYGEGIASRWQGPGVARNDCLWPWTDCTPIRITALDTGRSIVVRPTMFGDLYTRTKDQRLVDLDPAAVRALGLDWSRGLYPVIVEPVGGTIPDTAVAW
jgi:hypothetical protein